MEENKQSFDLFDCTPGGDWQVVDNSTPATDAKSGDDAPVLPETPVVAPQIWDDIPCEEPKPEPAPEVIAPAAETAAPLPETVAAEPLTAEAPQAEVPAAEISETSVMQVAENPPAEKISLLHEAPEMPETPAAEELPAASLYRYTAPAEISTLAEIGRYLASIRQKENLSEAEVSEATKIRGDYLAAIENGDASDLPQAVYVLAYIRKLCELYRVDTAQLGNFFADLRDGFSYELPEDINKSIIGHENDEEQQKKMRQLAIGLIAAAAIVIIALVAGAVTLIVALAGNSNGKACTTSDRKIIEYQGKPMLYMQKMPARR